MTHGGVYYNEFDPYAAQWLRELMKDGLIPEGEVDERDIKEVEATDLRRFSAVHLFAGIGGWPYALRLAGWPDDRPVWTGSCPCQPFSAAGKRKGKDDERDLWPEMFRLIKECRPPVTFGEQVASAEVIGTESEAAFLVAVQTGNYARANKLAKRLVAGRSFHFSPRWITRIRADLATEDYSLRWKVLGAHSVGAPHIRQRLYWVAESQSEGRPGVVAKCSTGERVGSRPGGDSSDGGMGHADRTGPFAGRIATTANGYGSPTIADGGTGGMEHPASNGREQGWAEPDGGYADAARAPGGVGDTGGAGLQERGSDGRVQREAGRSGSGETIELSGDVGSGVADAPGVVGGGGEHEPEREPEGRDADWRDRAGAGFWDAFDLIPCRDGKARRIEPGSFPLASRIPGRVGLLRGYGNSICPQTAAAFIQAYRETKGTIA